MWARSMCLGLLLSDHVTTCSLHPRSKVPRFEAFSLLGERDFRFITRKSSSPQASRLFCNVFLFPVGKAQLIGDWYENRRGAPNTIIFLIFRQYYWRTDAHCANRSGGPNTKKNYWRTVPGEQCLLARGTSERQYIGPPRPPCANILALRCPLPHY